MQEGVEASLLEVLLETGQAIYAEIEMEKLVQRITDIGTEVSGAQFGAFFYNVANEQGEKLVLYTISGVPREAFSKFPMPRNTAVFHPTFTGMGTVRYADVTAEAHYGKSDPHFGMPKGHLPVRSYLATSVISPVTKEVIGGLFFGHPEPGVFTERSEKLIEGIAAQAAIAMGNARLFEEKKRVEKNLRTQHEQYQRIFQSTTDAMLILNEKGGVVEANAVAAQLLGYRHADLVGRQGQELLDGGSLSFDTLLEWARAGRQYQGGAVCRRADGTLVEVELTATHFLHMEESQLLLVLKDLTADRRTEAALAESTTFSDVITRAAPICLWMSDAEGGITYVNATWTEWTGRPLAEHLGSGWAESILEEDREGALASFKEALQERRLFDADFRIRRRDGSVRWCVANGSPYYSQGGQLLGYSGSCVDITDRKETEEKLESQNVLIQTLTNNTLQALFMMNERQVCTYMNPAAEQMTGYRVEEVQEKPLHYYVHHTHPDGRHFPIEDCPIDRALPTRMQSQGEEVFIRKNGEFFPVAFVASPIIENGKPVGTVIEAWETTEEKRLQEELRNKEKQAMALLEEKVRERTAELEKINYELLQFTSVASHDLKEPVRKVSVFGSRLKEMAEGIDNPQFQRYLDNIINSSGRMGRLIDDLLSFSRLSQTNLHFTEVDLNSLLDQITDDLQLSIQDKCAVIDYQDLPVVRGISLQLGQVFQNLVSNSLKFSFPHRPPVIRIRHQRRGSLHEITYTDNGIGFREEHADKIFEVFERLHSRDAYEGTGIGLAIVKKIISLHGGTIRAVGRENEGATFVITLPSVAAEKGRASQERGQGVKL
jgi:PAS domain S-box-containing protein